MLLKILPSMSSDGTDQNAINKRNGKKEDDEKIFASIKLTFQSIVAEGMTKTSVDKVDDTAEASVDKAGKKAKKPKVNKKADVSGDSKKAKVSVDKVNDKPKAKKIKVTNETKIKKIKATNESKVGNVNHNYPYDFNMNHNYPLGFNTNHSYPYDFNMNHNHPLYFNANQSFIPNKRLPSEITDKKTKQAISLEILSAPPDLFSNYIENLMQPSRPLENANNSNEHVEKYDNYINQPSCPDYFRPNHNPIHYNVDHLGTGHFNPNYNNLNDDPINFNINNYHCFSNFNHQLDPFNHEDEYNNINESIQNSLERDKNANKELLDILSCTEDHKIAQDYPIFPNRSKFYEFTGKSKTENCYFSAIEERNQMNEKLNISKQSSLINMNTPNPVVNIEPAPIRTMSTVEVHKQYIKNLYPSTHTFEKKDTHVNQKLILKLKMPKKILDANGSETDPQQERDPKKDEVVTSAKTDEEVSTPPYKHLFIKIKAFKSDRTYDDQKALSRKK